MTLSKLTNPSVPWFVPLPFYPERTSAVTEPPRGREQLGGKGLSGQMPGWRKQPREGLRQVG